MATEDDSKRSKFLKKSKWGKLFKENDSSGTGGAGGGGGGGESVFKLNDDVQDFLKPSSEKNVPKLDISSAKRWPDSQQVRLAAAAAEAAAADDDHATKPKKRRKEGLTVSFVRTLPEVMGEGGDEAPDPPREISRRKAALGRSVSDRKPSTLPDGTPWPASPPLVDPRLPPDPPPHSRQVPELVPPPQLKRSQTSNMDFSVPLQRKFASPPAQELEPYRPSLGRTPTGGAAALGQHQFEENERPSSRSARPTVDTHFQQSRQEPDSAASIDQTPQDKLAVQARDLSLEPCGMAASSPVAAKRREMSTSEGMAFRRASMLMQNDEIGDDERPLSSGGPLHSLTSKDSYSSSHQYQPEVYQPPTMTPGTASTTQTLNPFSDPNYTKIHSGEVVHEQRRPPSSKGDAADRVIPQIISSAYSNQIGPLNNDPFTQPQSYRAYHDPMREAPRHPGQFDVPGKPTNFFTRPNGSSNSVNVSPPAVQHGRNISREDRLQPAGSSAYQQMASPAQGLRYQGSHEGFPQPPLLNSSTNAAPPHYSINHHKQFSASQTSLVHPQPARSPVAFLRQEERERPVSSASHYSLGREEDPAAEAAYADFAGRVSHMKGVFRLTAEKEQPSSRCNSVMWLRTGLWWYLKGKAGLEILLQQQDYRPLLAQAHVDLGKAWWILTEQLEEHDDSITNADIVVALRTHLKSLSVSMTKNRLLPPEQSLIQGQDTSIWLQYPLFTSDAAAVLGGNTSNSVLINERGSNRTVDPYELLQLGDSREFFCYGRFPVELYINTDEADTDRVLLPCILTVLRSRQDYQTSITIASQSVLVSMKIEPFRKGRRALTWSDVSWKPTADGLSIRLPRNFDAIVQMQNEHCRAVWNLSEYARKLERSLQPAEDELLVDEARLLELQYADSTNSNSFPAEKLRGCVVRVFEKSEQYRDGNGLRRFNRGFRVLLVTDPGHKTLSAVAMDVGKGAPVLFEFLTGADPTAGVGLLLRKRESTRQRRALMVFKSAERRERLFGLLNGAYHGVDDVIVGKSALTDFKIEALDHSQSAGSDTLSKLHWSDLTVYNAVLDEMQHPRTVESDHLRFVARYAAGTITDRLNLSKGELLLRLPPGIDACTIQLLRQPQADLTVTVDTQNASPQTEDSFTRLLEKVQAQTTLRTMTFATQSDLHVFQKAITGFAVSFDGTASTFGISRRRMVVPIYKKWEATNVRIQVLTRDGIVQVAAFMNDFKPADAMCFRVKSTDAFEAISGRKSFGVKFVDAKFTLPKEEERGEGKRLFVNLEGLEYAEEHDDISVGFEREEGRFLMQLSLSVRGRDADLLYRSRCFCSGAASRYDKCLQGAYIEETDVSEPGD